MFDLPAEIQALIFAFDGTFRETMADVLCMIKGIYMFKRYMLIERGYTIRNYLETGGHYTPRYVRVDLQGKVEVGGLHLRVSEKGYRCFAGKPL